jgi:hypothetical protein
MDRFTLTVFTNNILYFIVRTGIGMDLSLCPLVKVQNHEKKVTFANQIDDLFFGVTFCAIGHFLVLILLLLVQGAHNKTGN